MTTTFTIFKNNEVELTLDTKSSFELDIEYSHRDYFMLTDTPQGALDIATRIIYAVWVIDPDMADQLVERLAKDIPSVFNLMQRR